MEQVQNKSVGTRSGSLSTWFSLNLGSPRFIGTVLALLLLVMLGGCVLPDREFSSSFPEPARDAYNSARLNAFLMLKDDEGPAIRLEVASIEVLVNDLWLPLTREPIKIDSTKVGTGQLFLGGLSVPPGHYQRLRMTITAGEMENPDGQYISLIREPLVVQMSVAGALNLEEYDSRSLFITWDVESSLLTDNSLHPVLIAAPPTRQLQLDLIFVTCPNIDTVFAVRADKNWVVDSFGLKGRPTYLAIDPDTSRQRLYVLATDDRMVKVVDLSSFRVLDYYSVPLNDMPSFMTISPDGRAAYLLDEQSGYLSRMDLTTGRISARVLLGYRPGYAIYLDKQNLLAVSLTLSQRVVLLDPENLGIVGTITTGSGPQGLAVSENQLYVAESGDNSVSITDLDNRNSQSRIAVGFGPRRLQEIGSQIYVSNYQDGTVSVLLPGQLGVVQDIFDLGRPLEMVYDQFYRRVYVADEEAAALAVINASANQFLRRIYLGAKPFGLAVIQ